MNAVTGSHEFETSDLAVVIAVYNAASTLERCLDSIACQSLPVRQVVVMDGGSKDGTQDILARRSDVVTYWESAPDKGIYDAWNKALRHVTAGWVAFLGADDAYCDSNVVERLWTAAESAPSNTPFVYGRMLEVTAQGVLTETHGRPWQEVADRFRFEMTLPHPGMLHRRSAFFSPGSFDPSFRIAGDYALLRPVLLKQAPLFVDFPVVAAQEGGVSSHPARRVESVLEVGRAIRACDERPPLAWHWAVARNRARWFIWRFAGEAFMERVRAIYRVIAWRKRRHTR